MKQVFVSRKEIKEYPNAVDFLLQDSGSPTWGTYILERGHKGIFVAFDEGSLKFKCSPYLIPDKGSHPIEFVTVAELLQCTHQHKIDYLKQLVCP